MPQIESKVIAGDNDYTNWVDLSASRRVHERRSFDVLAQGINGHTIEVQAKRPGDDDSAAIVLGNPPVVNDAKREGWTTQSILVRAGVPTGGGGTGSVTVTVSG